MVAKNSMKVTMKRKTDSVDIEMIKAISVGDTLKERERETERNGLSKWINDDAIYCEME